MFSPETQAVLAAFTVLVVLALLALAFVAATKDEAKPTHGTGTPEERETALEDLAKSATEFIEQMGGEWDSVLNDAWAFGVVALYARRSGLLLGSQIVGYDVDLRSIYPTTVQLVRAMPWRLGLTDDIIVQRVYEGTSYICTLAHLMEECSNADVPEDARPCGGIWFEQRDDGEGRLVVSVCFDALSPYGRSGDRRTREV